MSDQHVVKSHQLFYVVNAKDETIAHVKTYGRHGVRWLTDVWVEPEHRRKGLATRLIRQALEAHAGEAIYLNVHGYTNQPLSDDELTAWYARFGFQPAGAPGVMVRPAPASLREALAALAHRQWSGWMDYLFRLSQNNDDGTVTIPADRVARWKRQMQTPYELLSGPEQGSDRIEADKVLALLRSGSTGQGPTE